LSLHNNQIGDNEIKYLADVLKHDKVNDLTLVLLILLMLLFSIGTYTFKPIEKSNY